MAKGVVDDADVRTWDLWQGCMYGRKGDSRHFGLSLLANYGGEGDGKKSKDWSP